MSYFSSSGRVPSTHKEKKGVLGVSLTTTTQEKEGKTREGNPATHKNALQSHQNITMRKAKEPTHLLLRTVEVKPTYAKNH